MWLPSVIASAPIAKSASASFGVMPIPPAAFSPLTTTKVGSSSSRSAGSSVSQRPPAGPADDVADEQDRGPPRHASRRYRPRSAYFSVRCRRSRIRTRLRPRASSRCCSRAGCSSCCCRWRSSASSAILRAAGPIVLLFIVAALIALLLNPFVVAAAPRPLPARAGGAHRDGGRGPRRDRDRLPARQPGLRPGVGVPAQRAGDRRRRERVAGRLPGLAGPQRDRRAGQGGGLDGAADARAQPLGGLGRARLVHQRRAADPRRGLDRADPRDRARASTCCSTASGSARPCARWCRAATARRRTTSRPGSRPRCSATCAASCCSR